MNIPIVSLSEAMEQVANASGGSHIAVWERAVEVLIPYYQGDRLRVKLLEVKSKCNRTLPMPLWQEQACSATSLRVEPGPGILHVVDRHTWVVHAPPDPLARSLGCTSSMLSLVIHCMFAL